MITIHAMKLNEKKNTWNKAKGTQELNITIINSLKICHKRICGVKGFEVRH